MTSNNIEKTIYLDNAATSYPKPDVVYDAMDTFARQVGGSGGRSSHRRAIESATVIDGARESLATLLGANNPECVCFAQNATEALNIAIYGLAQPGRRIITSMAEHNSVRRPLADLRDRCGCEVITVPADGRGKWDPRAVVEALRPETAFVVLSWASNVTGALQDIELVAHACRAMNVPLVVDGAQVCGVYPVNFKELGFAALAFTGHKSLLGSQGTGGLVVDPDLAPRIRPLKRGGSGTVSHSEVHPELLPDRFEAGTMNCHGLSGLYAGVGFLLERGVESVRAHEMALWRRFREGLREIGHVRVYGPVEADQSVSIVSVTVDRMEPTDVGFLLDMRHGILTRTGLHCAPGVHQVIGTLPTGTTRFSMGFSTTEADVDTALFALAHIREREARPSTVPTPARPAEASAAVHEKSYKLDQLGFLVDSHEWDEDFARGIAPSLGIPDGLTDAHWKVIRFLRAATAETGRCPLVYHTCKKTGLGLVDLQRLFPTGYLRGACKIAGITFRDGSFNEPRASKTEMAPHVPFAGKPYPVNAQGFLLSPIYWDETFAAGRADELGISGPMTDKHWQIIRWLRESFERTRQVPTVFETCNQCGVTIDEMEQLFPTGYHRGAVKVAGLRAL
ncbi:MAG: TusE/DsrC/DsvC family sulfur relay protein [Acidobacteria bacterium]|nr:TusE/DsrC/DsvC family sulfur relay protein [Acidobacteriota bacterium]